MIPNHSPKVFTVYGHVITNFLGWVIYHIFLPMLLRWARLARESSAVKDARFRVRVFVQLFFAPVTCRLFRGYFWRAWELPKGNERIHGIGKWSLLLIRLLQHGEEFDTLPQWEYCDCNHKTIWYGVLFATKGLVLLFGVFLAWETRHVKIPALNDSRYVGMSVYNVVILSVVGVPAALMIEKQQNATFALTAVFVLFCTTVTLCLVFVPKVNIQQC